MRRLFGYLAVAALALISSNGLAQTAPFRVTGNTTLSTSVATANVALPSVAPTVLLINTSTTIPVYVKFGGSGVTAAVTDYLLGPGCSAAYDINGQGYVAGITGSSTATVNVLTGSGSPPLPPSGCSVSVASAPLPTGAATAANQTATQGSPTGSVPATVDFVEPVDINGAQANFSSTVPVQSANDYPVGATPETGNATGTTGSVVGTLAAAANRTTYICGVWVSAVGGTAAVGPITIAGLITGSMVFQLSSAAIPVNLPVNFSRCIPASAANTTITVTTTADGTASAVDVNTWGYQL